LEDTRCGQENWQRLHPSCWTNGDVLDVIFYVVSESGPDAVHNLRGEKFQGLTGRDLYQMDRQDFRDRDSVYGDLLFDSIQDLLGQSEQYHAIVSSLHAPCRGLEMYRVRQKKVIPCRILQLLSNRFEFLMKLSSYILCSYRHITAKYRLIILKYDKVM